MSNRMEIKGSRTAAITPYLRAAMALGSRQMQTVGGEKKAGAPGTIPVLPAWSAVIMDPNFQDATQWEGRDWAVDQQAGTWSFKWLGGAFWKNWGGPLYGLYTQEDFPQGVEGRFTVTVDSIGGIPAPKLYLYNGDKRSDKLTITGPGTFSKVMTFDYNSPGTYPEWIWQLMFDDTLPEAYLQEAVISYLQVHVRQ